MNEREQLQKYRSYLIGEGYSENTVLKYIRDVKNFLSWKKDSKINPQKLSEWKQYLISNYALVSVNSMLVALNQFLAWIGYRNWMIRLIKIQEKIFADPRKELTKQEYRRLVETAERLGKHRLALILRTLGMTGIRISELKYITVEVLKDKMVSVCNKGKIRKILLPTKLCHILRDYCKREKILSGMIFLTRNKRPLNRSNIWREMKKLFEKSGVPAEKIFPHNLRHLFARTFYEVEKDLVRLSDLLGHSNLSTTRIYIRESGEVHRKILEKMELFCECDFSARESVGGTDNIRNIMLFSPI